MYNYQLKAFVCAADCGSFTKASEKLFISSTSIMKQINALEKHLDMKLMERTNQGIQLTDAGKIIYKYAVEIFEYSEKAVAEARQTMDTVETTFCVGSSILNGCKPFMDLWYQVNEAFPGYKLHIVPFEDSHEGILSEIEALGEKFDFLVAVCDSSQWLSRCSFQPLGTYQHCCAVSREHRLSHHKRLTMKDLYGETLMMVKRGDSATVDRIRDEIEGHPQIEIEDTPPFYDMEVFNRCAQTGKVLVTVECWKDVHPALVTIPVEWDYPIPWGLLYSNRSSEDIRKFLKIVSVYTSGERGDCHV